jgi:hypothetical protein
MRMWNSPIPEKRWKGFRSQNRGKEAFLNLSKFEEAVLSELQNSLEEHEISSLGRLLSRGKKPEIELFIRTHGPNPLFDPQGELEFNVGVAHADVIPIEIMPTSEALDAVVSGAVLHALFQAGDATRFNQGPFYSMNPLTVARSLMDGTAPSDDSDGTLDASCLEEVSSLVKQIELKVSAWPVPLQSLFSTWGLGPKQMVCLRAALRRVIHFQIETGHLGFAKAKERYKEAISNQKIIFFLSRRGDVAQMHDRYLRQSQNFFGFNPSHLITIEQELAQGVMASEEGQISLSSMEETRDASGHLYALLQACRAGDFTSYTDSGKPIKPMEIDAFSYALSQGAKYLNVVRINDMDRQTTEIINPRALSYALAAFDDGYKNVIETVANPLGQKGGTGTTFNNPDIHVLTETHENSFPLLSRAFEEAMKDYLERTGGRPPAYNAMRQWSDLAETRRVVREFGGRIVFVPREKKIGDKTIFYLGVDMPMGDLSLLYEEYKSRMFQFSFEAHKELCIHDMKQKNHLSIGLRTILKQLNDPHVLAAAKEIISGEIQPFTSISELSPYGAPCPEFEKFETVK